MNTQKEDQEVFESQCFDPFPQPQTIPSGWDLSELFPAPALDPDQQAQDFADSASHEWRHVYK